MMKHLVLAAICLVSCKLSVAQNTIDIWADKNLKSEVTKDKLVSDITNYKNAVTQNHINPFTHISSADFDKAIDSLIYNADRYNIDELLVALLQINGRINDEHTNLRYMFQSRFPIFCYTFTDGTYITATDMNNREYMFAKVTAVNGVPIDKVKEKLATIVPSRNKGQALTFSTRNLFNPYLLHGLGLSAAREKVQYTAVAVNGDTIKINPGISEETDLTISKGANPARFFRSRHKKTYWFADTANCLYFKYYSCVNDPSYPIDAFKKDLVSKIESMHPDKLIIDMRENEGGNSALINDFINYLSTSYLSKKGRLYVLIGRTTFSSAVLNALQLKLDANAILVGEETGGSVNNFGDIKSYVLPETKIKLNYSTKRFNYKNGYDGPLQPDVPINNRFADYVRYIDVPLEYAMTH